MNYEEKLQDMMSEVSYKELQIKVKKMVGEGSFLIIFPSVAKALVEGGRDEREHILIAWLDMDTCRVCTTCGKIMSEGWYLNDAGYACSDECAAKSEGISMEEFKRYRIYKDDIKEYLSNNGDKRAIEELTQQECDDIIDEIMDNCDYYWTEWDDCGEEDGLYDD